MCDVWIILDILVDSNYYYTPWGELKVPMSFVKGTTDKMDIAFDGTSFPGSHEGGIRFQSKFYYSLFCTPEIRFITARFKENRLALVMNERQRLEEHQK